MTPLQIMAREIDPQAWEDAEGSPAEITFANRWKWERRKASIEKARKALEAIREPMPAIIAAAWTVVIPNKRSAGIARLGPGPGCSEVWQAMIDAILNEGQTD